MTDSMARARVLVRTLVAEGVLNWYYAPGSRDAPLGYALAELAARDPRLALHVRIDERDAAFMALGSARASGRPAAVVMTSGTAVGNALPAVMEAYHALVPLLVVSADRPAELRGSGANQTTIQPGIFRSFVRFEADLQPGGLEAGGGLESGGLQSGGLDVLESAARAAVAACCGCPGAHEVPAGIPGQSAEPLDLPEPGNNTVTFDANAGEVATETEIFGHDCGQGRRQNRSQGHDLRENQRVNLGQDCGWEQDWNTEPAPGPAHLNIGFVEPLVPPAVQARFESRTHKEISTVARGVKHQFTDSGEFQADSKPPQHESGESLGGDGVPESGLAPHESALPKNPTTSGDVLIVGDLPREDFPGAEELWRATEAAGVPVFAEPTTRWRAHPHAVPAYSRVLDWSGWARAIRRVLVVGRPTLTRPVTRLLHESRAEFLDSPGLRINLDGGEHRRWNDATALAASLEANPDKRSTASTVAGNNRRLEPVPRVGTGQATKFGAAADYQPEHAESWLEQWRQASEAVARELCSEWGIYQVAREIWVAGAGMESETSGEPRSGGEPVDLFLGSSSTIRAFDAVAGKCRESGLAPHEPAINTTQTTPTDACGQTRRVYANRGLAGIDGTIACAWGTALASQAAETAENPRDALAGNLVPQTADSVDAGVKTTGNLVPGQTADSVGGTAKRAMRLVLGDVSFFHDLGALVRGRLEVTPNLQVIVLDNDGGQIFAGLEHGCAEPGVLARMFLTPQASDPVALARAAGWQTETVCDLGELRSVLARPVVGLSLVRVVLAGV